MVNDEELPWRPGAATGVGSLPGLDPLEACRTVVGELPELPYLPELPNRGTGADLIGRACTLLVDLHVDQQPAGWRLMPGEGLDERRAVSLLTQDLDALEQVAHDYVGPLKVQVCGPWTLAAGLERPRGDRVLADHGARRDVAESLGEGIADLLARLRRCVPGARAVMQLDEPSLPAVLAGRIPTASGFSRHRSVEAQEVLAVLERCVAGIRSEQAVPVLHCCADGTPFELVIRAGFDAVSIDPRRVADTDLDTISAGVESGLALFVGAVPSVPPESGTPPSDADIARVVQGFWQRLGFSRDDAGHGVVVTPACGLAGASPDWARRAIELTRRAAANLVDANGSVGGRL